MTKVVLILDMNDIEELVRDWFNLHDADMVLSLEQDKIKVVANDVSIRE